MDRKKIWNWREMLPQSFSVLLYRMTQTVGVSSFLDTLAGCTKCSLAVPLVRLWLYNFYALLKKQEHFIYWKMLLVFCKLIASTCHHSTISFSISFLHLLPPVLSSLVASSIAFCPPFILFLPYLSTSLLSHHPNSLRHLLSRPPSSLRLPCFPSLTRGETLYFSS